MGGKVGRLKKFQRDIECYRKLYESKDLRRVRDNWVFYWRFLAHLQDIGYRTNTIQDIINNTFRRHLKSIMRDNGLKTFTELQGFLKKSC